MFRFRKTQLNKTAKSSTIKKEAVAEIKPKINRYDVLFDLSHLESLLKNNDCYASVPNYINNFFFKYGNDIFFDNGEQRLQQRL